MHTWFAQVCDESVPSLGHRNPHGFDLSGGARPASRTPAATERPRRLGPTQVPQPSRFHNHGHQRLLSAGAVLSAAGPHRSQSVLAAASEKKPLPTFIAFGAG
jgi:hypothetical protein